MFSTHRIRLGFNYKRLGRLISLYTILCAEIYYEAKIITFSNFQNNFNIFLKKFFYIHLQSVG